MCVRDRGSGCNLPCEGKGAFQKGRESETVRKFKSSWEESQETTTSLKRMMEKGYEILSNNTYTNTVSVNITGMWSLHASFVFTFSLVLKLSILGKTKVLI